MVSGADGALAARDYVLEILRGGFDRQRARPPL